MNEFAAFPRPTMGGYWVLLRFARDAHPKPLMRTDDAPHIFPTECEAWKECTRHLLRFMNGAPIRSEHFETTKTTDAAAIFAGLQPFARERKNA